MAAQGGAITIKAGNMLTINGPIQIDADGNAGGDQSGTGGKGGASGAAGGKGGSVEKQGNGGRGGNITINYEKASEPAITATVNGGAVGNQTGKAGDGGNAPETEGPGNVNKDSAKPGADGTVTING